MDLQVVDSWVGDCVTRLNMRLEIVVVSTKVKSKKMMRGRERERGSPKPPKRQASSPPSLLAWHVTWVPRVLLGPVKASHKLKGCQLPSVPWSIGALKRSLSRFWLPLRAVGAVDGWWVPA
jgi:hypothetical protein